jgi:O-acetyl-ADP-ribose deacetylase (regulator of RNase III)
MIYYSDSTVFNVPVQTIVNTVNCVGVMGAGLALEFQLRFPEMYEDYTQRCKQKKVQTGRPYVYREYGQPWIVNFPTKNHWKYPSKVEWIEQGLQYFADKYKQGGITSIAFPKLGCDKGGLDWNIVNELMTKYLDPLNIEIYICLDRERQASGIEKTMLDLLKNNIDQLYTLKIELRDDIIHKLKYALPVVRFREILTIEGVGKQTYLELFRSLYCIAKENYVGRNNLSNVEVKETQKIETQRVLSSLPVNRSSDLETKEIIEQDRANAVHLSGINSLEIDNINDMFDYILPLLEKKLSKEWKSQDLARVFNVRDLQMKDWLEKGVEIGKFKKLSKPVRYISKIADQQLELPLKI